MVMQARTFIIGRDEAGRPLLEVLRRQLRLPKVDAMRALRERRVRLNGKACAQPQRRVQAGQRVQIQLEAEARPSLPPVARAIRLRHVDAHIIVVEKPAGLTTVRHADETAEFGKRAKRFLPQTLVDLLPAVLAARGVRGKGRIRAVHRLDKETSGLLVLARTPAAESSLGRQLRAHTVGRRYLALVRGRAQDQRIESHFVPDRGDGRRGSSPSGEGQLAITHVRVVEELGDFTLVECRLETGRTHQVRIHLGEAGTPLCGERIYDRPLHGKPLPDGSGMKRVALHAALLGFEHPATGERMRWTSNLPRDMADLIKRLRRVRE
jgi:23S rRNA pseudouridine1911/1915/1917 synthase